MKILEHIKELRIIDTQRKGWMVLSALVAITVAGIIFGWETIHTSKIVWLVVSAGLIISMIWWYWTMRLIRHLIHFKVAESELLIEIVSDIRHVKDEVRKSFPTPVDKDK